MNVVKSVNHENVEFKAALFRSLKGGRDFIEGKTSKKDVKGWLNEMQRKADKV